MPKVNWKKLDFSRKLRHEQTDAEAALWKLLRSRQFDNYKFRRQHVIGRFIVDFCCLNPRLVIELDGGQHKDNKSYDKRRSEFLEQEGFKVIRFWDNQVLTEMESVVERIYGVLAALGPHPRPLPTRGRERE